jgi:hypothetical protein
MKPGLKLMILSIRQFMEDLCEILKNFIKIACSPALLFLAVAVIQGMSLLRNYFADPVCGRILNIGMDFNVLINCDSAVFMKDAQNPMRLFDGQSVYQDRPGHASVIWFVGNFLKRIGFPNQTREIVGTSGAVTQYDSVFYLSFLLLNFLVLCQNREQRPKLFILFVLI